MSSRPLRRFRIGALIAAALVAGIVIVAPTSAAGPKSYLATATPSVYAGQATIVAITVENTSRNRIEFDAVRITIPPTFVPFVTGPATATVGTVVLNGSSGVIELGDANVGKGSSVVVSVPVQIPCTATSGSGTWTTDVRQSNDFNGTDNKFAGDAADPVTVVVGPCRLVFTGQPSDAEAGAVITTTPFNTPPGLPVSVTVYDGRSSGAAPVTSLNPEPLITLTPSPAVQTLTGDTATTTNGAASFGTLSAVPVQTDALHQLTASSPGYTSVTSNQFRLLRTSANVTCGDGDGQPCTTGVITSPSGQTANVVVNEGDGLEANLTASFGPADIDCPYYDEVSDQLTFDILNLNGHDLSNVTKTVTITVADDRPELWEYQVCFQAPYEFPAIVLSDDGADDGTESSLDALWAAISLGEFAAEPVGGGEYRGLLLPCLLDLGPPCIEDRNDLGATVEIIITTPAADPAMRF